MIKYEVKPVVCDYGVYENEELKLILNCRSNAQIIANILSTDLENKEYTVLVKREIDIDKINNFADYLIENASYAFEHQDREFLEKVLRDYKKVK